MLFCLLFQIRKKPSIIAVYLSGISFPYNTRSQIPFDPFYLRVPRDIPKCSSISQLLHPLEIVGVQVVHFFVEWDFLRISWRDLLHRHARSSIHMRNRTVCERFRFDGAAGQVLKDLTTFFDVLVWVVYSVRIRQGNLKGEKKRGEDEPLSVTISTWLFPCQKCAECLDSTPR